MPQRGDKLDKEKCEFEVCICAAVRYDGKVWMGHRHAHAYSAMTDELSYEMSRREMRERGVSRAEQGFMTTGNRFVDREEGYRLQVAAGIKSHAADGYRNMQLFSEDLY